MAPLQITKTLSITPLIEIQSPIFAERYVIGVRGRLFPLTEQERLYEHALSPVEQVTMLQEA